MCKNALFAYSIIYFGGYAFNLLLELPWVWGVGLILSASVCSILLGSCSKAITDTLTWVKMIGVFILTALLSNFVLYLIEPLVKNGVVFVIGLSGIQTLVFLLALPLSRSSKVIK